MTLPVWMYWEGEAPEWIQACQRTVAAHAPDVRLLTASEFDALRDVDRDIDLGRLYIAHRADYVRAFVLARFGGLWVDSDCIAIHSLEPVLKEAAQHDFVGYKEREGHVANNFMGARPGSRIASAYFKRVGRLLREGKRLAWLTLGSEALTQTIQEQRIPWRRMGYELVQPVSWSDPGAFFARRDREGHDRVFNERSYCYMLSNHMIQGFQADHPEVSLTADNSFFTYLLRRADGDHRVLGQPRRTSVGTSNWQQIPFCVEAMLDICPLRVLDVGIGFGRWGVLVREFCEEWKGRIHRENWRVHLEGIEAYPKNVEEYHHLFYNWVHIGDAAEIIGQMTERWDLIIFGDVLEHWVKERAAGVLDQALNLSDYVLVNIPVGPGWERGGMYENPWEEHKSFWQLDEWIGQQPVRYALFKEYNQRDYGAFVLSRTDPRGLRR